MSKSLYQSLQDILTCPLSYELFQSPVKPDCCDHVFEQAELIKWKNTREEKNRNNPDESFHFDCPTCRTHIKSFAADLTTTHLLALYKGKHNESLMKHIPDTHIDSRPGLVTYLVMNGFADTVLLKTLQTEHFFLKHRLSRDTVDLWLLKSLSEYRQQRTKEASGADPKKHRRRTFGYSCHTKITSSTELQQLIKTGNPKHFHTLRRQYWLPITNGRLYSDIFRTYIILRGIHPRFLEHSANAWARITREELKHSKADGTLTLN